MYGHTLNKKRSGIALLEVIGVVIVMAVMIALGAYFVGQVQSAIDTSSASDLPLEARSAINESFESTWDIWDLLPILMIVVVIGAALYVFRSQIFGGES